MSDSTYGPKDRKNAGGRKNVTVAFCALMLAVVMSYQNCASFKVSELGDYHYSSNSALPDLKFAITTVYFHDDRDMKRITKNYCHDGENMPGVQSDEIYVDYIIDENINLDNLDDLELFCKLAESVDEYTRCEDFYLQNQASISNYIQYDEDGLGLNFIRYKYTNLENGVYEFDVYASTDSVMLTDVTKVRFQICD